MPRSLSPDPVFLPLKYTVAKPHFLRTSLSFIISHLASSRIKDILEMGILFNTSRANIGIDSEVMYFAC